MTTIEQTAPTRIISQPYKKKIPGHVNKVLVCDCNDGQTYSVYDLAALKNISYQAMIQRLRIMGWEHPDILGDKAERGFTICGKAVQKAGKKSGNAAWDALSRTQPRVKSC